MYRLHGDRWVRFARRHTGSDELGEEVFAEAMCRICARLDELVRITPAYVITTIRRVADELHTKERNRCAGESEAIRERRLERVGPPRPDEFTVRRERDGRLYTALGELPEEKRRVISLTELLAMTQEEAAEELGIRQRR